MVGCDTMTSIMGIYTTSYVPLNEVFADEGNLELPKLLLDVCDGISVAPPPPPAYELV